MWLGWREEGDFMWISQHGERLPNGPDPGSNAFVCVELRPEDVIRPHMEGRQWMTVEEFAASSPRRRDHLRILQKLEAAAAQEHEIARLCQKLEEL